MRFELLGVEHVVQGDRHMLGAHELHHVVDMPGIGGTGNVVATQEDAHPVDAHHAPRGGAGTNQLVRDVAGVGVQRRAVAVREDHRTRGDVEHLPHGTVPRVAHAHLHAHALHLGHHGTAERREACVVGLTAAAHAIGFVVGHQHPAHTQVVVQLNQAELIANRIGALDVEPYRQAARGASPLDVVRLQQKQVLVRTRHQPMAHRGDHPQVLFRALLTEADVHGDGVETGGFVARQLRQKGGVQRTQRHAGVVVPDRHGIDEPARGGGRGVMHERPSILGSDLTTGGEATG